MPGTPIDAGAAADTYWRHYLTRPGAWLENTTWTNVSTLEQLVAAFPDIAKAGVVLYDPAVPATSNLASTAAGVEGLLPVCHRPGQAGSVYERLIANGPRLPVSLNLTGLFRGHRVNSSSAMMDSMDSMDGPTAKIQAYRWARKRWLSPSAVPERRANPAKLGYYVDYWGAQQGERLKATPGLTEISNHDYFIAHKAFFFDLSIWADETPVDDPMQQGAALGADRAELIAIFESAYALTQAKGYSGPEMLHVGGFTPWWFKYTRDGPGCPTCKHKGVETEWETMGVIGAYNAFDDGDACCVGAMANSAFYQHYPLPPKLTQNVKPTVADLQTRGLVDIRTGKVAPRPFAAYYAGDYDGSAWLYNQLAAKWDDPKRGRVPIGWAIDSELSMRFPVVYDHIYKTRTANDFFISGDSGAGYLNPTLLLPDAKTGRRGASNVTKSGADAWVAWNKRWYTMFDLSFTGFLINGDQGPLTNGSIAMYDSFSPYGVVVTTNHDPVPERRGDNGAAGVDDAGTPIMHHVTDLPGNVATAISTIAGIIKADRMKGAGEGAGEAAGAAGASFYILRNILQTATYMVDVAEGAMEVVPGLLFVDPYTMGLLVKCNTGALDCSASASG